MIYIEANIEENIVLQLIVKSKNQQLVDQPTGYPKVAIYRMDGTVATEVLASTQMVEHISGEYQYKWTASSVVGFYKATYEVKINDIVFYSHDIIKLTSPIDRYEGFGV